MKMKKPIFLLKLKEIEDEGCNCDIMNGWFCPIHLKVRELKKLLRREYVKRT